MKLSNKKILEFANSRVQRKKFPIRMSHAIAVTMENVKPVIEAYGKQRKDLIDEYLEKDENGKPIKVEAPGGNAKIEEGFKIIDPEALNTALDELLNAESEVVVTKFSENLLERCEEEKYDLPTAADIMAMSFMIE